MRKIVIPQPWASMIAAGVINVFDLGIDLGTEPCIVLIVAAPWQKYDNSKKIPLEWLQALEIAQLLGLVPLYRDMPFNCIIGYVTAARESNLLSFYLFYSCLNCIIISVTINNYSIFFLNFYLFSST